MKTLYELLRPWRPSPTGDREQMWREEVLKLGAQFVSVGERQFHSLPKPQYDKSLVPVRIFCDYTAIRQIVNYTLDFYKTDQIIWYPISDRVEITHANKKML